MMFWYSGVFSTAIRNFKYILLSGLYIHIPFCKQACHYCNFHFSTSLKLKDRMLLALLNEIDLQKDYLTTRELSSIYFGGGTPSLLDKAAIELIFSKIKQHFVLAKDAEITLEANPDDLTKKKLADLATTPINRLSIGIQSFSEADLNYMNRAHTASEASHCIENAQEVGFQNLTVDLIYGTPTTSHEQWATNIEQVLDSDIPHISCYCLTVEPKTALAHFVKAGKYAAPDDEYAAQQFEYLIERLDKAGYDHYEISNFAKPNHYAQHNSNYWLGQQYLGIGPSAHSFDGRSRQWNIAHNMQYIQAIEAGRVPFEIEELSSTERYNEYVMTALRTIWGCDIRRIREIGGTFEKHFLEEVRPFLQNGTMLEKEGVFTLTKAGKLLADNIAMELFL